MDGWTRCGGIRPIYETLWWRDLTEAGYVVLLGALEHCHWRGLKVGEIEAPMLMDTVLSSFQGLETPKHPEMHARVLTYLSDEVSWYGTDTSAEVRRLCAGLDKKKIKPQVWFSPEPAEVREDERKYTHACACCGEAQCICLM